MPCVNKVLQLVVSLMIHDINFNKVTFIAWLKMFIMLKHVFTTCPMQLQCLTLLKK
jgi:hypothetical protein